MFQAMQEACNQYHTGLITAGELRHKLVKVMLDNELTLDVVACPEFDKLAFRLIENT